MKTKLPIFCLFLVVVLNSVVIASPAYPAIITHGPCRDRVFEKPTIVFPFTRWTTRPRFYSGSVVAYFDAIEDKEIWVLKATYSVKHEDISQEVEGWRLWLENVLSNYVVMMKNSFYTIAPANMTNEERVAFLTDNFSDPNLLLEIGNALMVNFNKAHEGLMRARSIRVEVMMLSLDEFLKARDGG